MEAGWKTRWPSPKAPNSSLVCYPTPQATSIHVQNFDWELFLKMKNKTKKPLLRQPFNSAWALTCAMHGLEYRIVPTNCYKCLWTSVLFQACMCAWPTNQTVSQKEGLDPCSFCLPLPPTSFWAHLSMGQAAFCDHLRLLLWLWEQAGPLPEWAGNAEKLVPPGNCPQPRMDGESHWANMPATLPFGEGNFEVCALFSWVPPRDWAPGTHRSNPFANATLLASFSSLYHLSTSWLIFLGEKLSYEPFTLQILVLRSVSGETKLRFPLLITPFIHPLNKRAGQRFSTASSGSNSLCFQWNKANFDHKLKVPMEVTSYRKHCIIAWSCSCPAPALTWKMLRGTAQIPLLPHLLGLLLASTGMTSDAEALFAQGHTLSQGGQQAMTEGCWRVKAWLFQRKSRQLWRAIITAEIPGGWPKSLLGLYQNSTSFSPYFLPTP